MTTPSFRSREEYERWKAIRGQAAPPARSEEAQSPGDRVSSVGVVMVLLAVVVVIGLFLLAPEYAIWPPVLGVIPALIAHRKGYGFMEWWAYGTLLFIIALPRAITIRPNVAGVERQRLAEGDKKCPFCAELIKAEAKVCRYCGRDLPVS